MRLPLRLVVPVVTALLLTAALLVFLWWQLAQSGAALQLTSGTGAALIALPGTPTAVVVDPRDTALLHLRQGDLLALRGEWAGAQREYALAVENDGGLAALRKLAQAQLQRRDIDGARATLRKLKSAGARAEDVLLLESIIDLRTGELVAAHALLDGAPDSPQKHYGLALLAIVEGKHDDANAHLQTVMNGWEPVLRTYARTIQAAYQEFGLFPESDNSHLLALLARALAQVQECEIALPLLAQVTQARDQYRDAWIVQGYCELTTERAQQALASLEHAYNLDPQKPEVQYFLGRAYAALGDHRSAITFFSFALSNGFDPPGEVRRLLAAEALGAGDLALALTQYELLMAEEDATIEAFRSAIETYLAANRAAEARIAAEQAIERWPGDDAAYVLLARVLMQESKPEEAAGALQKALEINPYSAEARALQEQLGLAST